MPGHSPEPAGEPAAIDAANFATPRRARAVLAEPMNRVSRDQEDIAMLPSQFRPLKTRSLSSRLIARS